MTKSRKPSGKSPRPPSQPDPIVVANRPMLALESRGGYNTDESLSIQAQWEALVDAGKFKTG